MRTETSYLGMRLAHPLSPALLHWDIASIPSNVSEDAGCAAVVLHSLFEEQITFEEQERIAGISPYDRDSADVFAEFPDPESARCSPTNMQSTSIN